jgi:hypothetical protein
LREGTIVVTLRASTSKRTTHASRTTELHPVVFEWKGYKVQFERAYGASEREPQYYARRTDVRSLRWYRYIACVVRQCFGLEGGSRWKLSPNDVAAMHRKVGQWYRIETLPAPFLAQIAEQLRASADVRGILRLASISKQTQGTLADIRQREKHKDDLQGRAMACSEASQLLKVLAEMAVLDQPFRARIIQTLVLKVPYFPGESQACAWAAIVTAIEGLEIQFRRAAMANTVGEWGEHRQHEAARQKFRMAVNVARRLLALCAPLFAEQQWWLWNVMKSAFNTATEAEIEQCLDEIDVEYREPMLSVLACAADARADRFQWIFQTLKSLPLPHNVLLIRALSRYGAPAPGLTAHAQTLPQPYRLQAELLLMHRNAWSHDPDIDGSSIINHFLSHTEDTQAAALPTLMDVVSWNGVFPRFRDDHERLVDMVHRSPVDQRDQLVFRLAKGLAGHSHSILALRVLAIRTWQPPLPEQIVRKTLEVDPFFPWGPSPALREQLLEAVRDLCRVAVPQLSVRSLEVLATLCHGAPLAAAFIGEQRRGLPAQEHARVLACQTAYADEVALHRSEFAAAAVALPSPHDSATVLLALFRACKYSGFPYHDVVEPLLAGWRDEHFAAVLFPALGEIGHTCASGRDTAALCALIAPMTAAAAQGIYTGEALPEVIAALSRQPPSSQRDGYAVCNALLDLIETIPPANRHRALLQLVTLSHRWFSTSAADHAPSAAAFGNLLERIANVTSRAVSPNDQGKILSNLILVDPELAKEGWTAWLLQKVLPNRSLLPPRIRRIANAVKAHSPAHRWPVFAAMLMRHGAGKAERHYAFARIRDAAEAFRRGSPWEYSAWKCTPDDPAYLDRDWRTINPYHCLLHPEEYASYNHLLDLASRLIRRGPVFPRGPVE